MKKILSVALVVVMLVATMLTLASCGIGNGTYKSEFGNEVTINGSKMTSVVEIPVVGEITIVQKYEIVDAEEEGKKNIVLTYDSYVYEGDSNTFAGILEDAAAEFADDYSSTVSYEKVDGGFKMGGVLYTKQ